jgi:hypothetical protein
LSCALDLASIMVSSIFFNVAPEIEVFIQLVEIFPSLLQLYAPSKTFTESSSSSNFPNFVVGICTILPRKGKPPNITKCNETV